MDELFLRIERTARVYALGPRPGEPAPDRVWIACHGYSQLAGRFIRYLEPLRDGRTLVVAPEALSRFYVNRFSTDPSQARTVGASWMTREDRDHEIADYVGYLSRVWAEIRERCRSTPALIGAGFSQGCATISRWVAAGSVRVSHLVLWGGTTPPDMDLAALAAGLGGAPVLLVCGRTDEFVTGAALVAEERRLEDAGIACHTHMFDGGHHLDKTALAEVARLVNTWP